MYEHHLKETLYLASVPGMREPIKEGMAEPLGKSAKSLNSDLTGRLRECSAQGCEKGSCGWP